MYARPLLLLGVIAAIALSARDAPAGCTVGSVSVFPTSKVALPANGRLMLEGTGNMVEAVVALADDELVLTSAHDTIPLRVVGHTRGTWNIAQAILAPARELPEGEQFSLRAVAPGAMLDAALRRQVPTWITTARLDTADVRWTSQPAPGPADVGGFCLRHAYVPVRVSVDHPDRLLGVMAEVLPAKRGGEVSRFLLPVYQGEIYLGQAGCDVPLILSPGIAHRVTLTAVDLAGHEIKAAAPVTIVGPR
jgi:hypothetical protein